MQLNVTVLGPKARPRISHGKGPKWFAHSGVQMFRCLCGNSGFIWEFRTV